MDDYLVTYFINKSNNKKQKTTPQKIVSMQHRRKMRDSTSIDNRARPRPQVNLLSQLCKQLVWGSLCNRDYEEEIQEYGDTVKIRHPLDDISYYAGKQTIDLTF